MSGSTQMFEYDGFLVGYDADRGDYTLIDIGYEVVLGTVGIESGPGAVLEINPECGFMDASMAQSAAGFLSDLNDELDTDEPLGSRPVTVKIVGPDTESAAHE